MIRYKVKEHQITNIEYGTSVTKTVVLIVREFYDEEGTIFSIPSCFSTYLQKWRNKSINNACSMGYFICSFLNYVIAQTINSENEIYNVIKREGLYGLSLSHAADFLNYCIIKRKIIYSTAKQYTFYMIDFYKFLILSGVIEDEYEIKKQEISYSIFSKTDKFNPFNDPRFLVYYPDKINSKIKKLVNMDEHMWQLFLDISQKVSADITFAIALQFFGGLRRGEVVNLDISDIKRIDEGKTGNIDLYIVDRKKEFFEGRKNIDLSKSEVKKPRGQTVFNFNGRLHEYFNQHMIIRNNISIKSGYKTTALFLNKDGLPMDGRTYEKKWNYVKKVFLKYLNEYNVHEYFELTDISWGTHIGRGIFTNLCLKYNFARDARELANLRGDASIDSSQPYIDEYKKIKIINESSKAFDDKEKRKLFFKE